MILINRKAVVAYAVIACAAALPAQQGLATAEMAQTPEMKLRSMIMVPEKKHSDADFAYNMLQAMFDKAKATNPSLTPRAFVLAFHDKAVAGNVDAGYYYGAARMAGFGIGYGPDKEVEGYIGAAAKAGKLEAIRDYAVLTFKGAGVKEDAAAAYQLAKKAADGGLASGMTLAAEFLQAGVGVKEDAIEAALLFKKGAEAGDMIGAYNMGELLSQANPTTAMRYFMADAASGDDRGMLAYGMAQVRGKGTTQNEEEGVRLVQAAAQKGNPTAQRLIAIFYTNGSHGVKQDDTAGRLYMEAAATNDDSEAQIEFGLMNLDGDMGVPRNHDVGMEWMMKAAKQKNPRALEEMKKRM
jgi:TPR repeat protein